MNHAEANDKELRQNRMDDKHWEHVQKAIDLTLHELLKSKSEIATDMTSQHRLTRKRAELVIKVKNKLTEEILDELTKRVAQK